MCSEKKDRCVTELNLYVQQVKKTKTKNQMHVSVAPAGGKNAHLQRYLSQRCDICTEVGITVSLFKNKDPWGPESSCTGTVGASYVGVGYRCCVRALPVQTHGLARRPTRVIRIYNATQFSFFETLFQICTLFVRRHERLRQNVAI